MHKLNFWSSSSDNGQASGQDDEGSLKIPLETLGLHTLYEPKDKNITMDIVAVHGLGGDSFSTWTDKASGCLWLRDLLPQQEALKGARIMTFGYDARAFLRPFEKSTTGRTFTFAEALLFDLSNARIDQEQARSRPLVFVGHSLGGNVIKSALVGANNQQNLYGDILKSTQCLIFFGTPHQGADAAVWGTYLGNLAQGIGIRSTEVTQELMRWSNPLVELRVNFAQLAPRYLIRTFFETRKKYNVLVVPEMSARFGTDNDQAVGLDADHLDICKFGNGKTPNASRVLQTFAAVSKLMEARIESAGASSLEERLEALRRSA
ncbi:hypothetical protein DL98DRAFT_512067 [Cadophora sp. DSE1049]|nr:hypothetical protein DL98DRAFT_512067 [Cadophora sp. DSE1049]